MPKLSVGIVYYLTRTITMASLLNTLLSTAALGDHASIGVAGAVWGNVKLSHGRREEVSLVSGSSVSSEDVVTTGPKSRTQLMFIDESTLLLGSNAQVKLDGFVFGGKSEPFENLSITKGAFRFVSGAIARSTDDGVVLGLPTITLIIRGTILMGNCIESACDVWLEGPGDENVLGEKGTGAELLAANGSRIILRMGQKAHIDVKGFVSLSSFRQDDIASFAEMFSPVESRAPNHALIDERLLELTADALKVQPELSATAIEDERSRGQAVDKLQLCCALRPMDNSRHNRRNIE